MIWALVVITFTNHQPSSGCTEFPPAGISASVTSVPCPAYTTEQVETPVRLFASQQDCQKAQGSTAWTGGWTESGCIPIDLKQLGKEARK